MKNKTVAEIMVSDETHKVLTKGFVMRPELAVLPNESFEQYMKRMAAQRAAKPRTGGAE